jgi:hypothetical protein
MNIEKYPLCWPVGYPREQRPSRSRFGNNPFGKTRDEIFKQLRLMLSWKDRENVILSTNIPLKNDGYPYANYKQLSDKGVAVYFRYQNTDTVICCDKWDKIEDNLWAVAKTIESMRAIDRWGVSDFMKRSFTGFNALPPKQPDKPKREWWQVMTYSQKPGNASWDWAGVEAQYKSLAKQRHPDVVGGSVEQFQELSNAFAEAKKYYGKG